MELGERLAHFHKCGDCDGKRYGLLQLAVQALEVRIRQGRVRETRPVKAVVHVPRKFFHPEAALRA